ncbi:hypothetical protein GCM10009740_14660 [Terrabacter terrae]|uniref:Uncharacterized protein n=1 Tax=Terrabacter terrae TaxID=318434 RepID=A0ABN2U207_9MICO
MGRADRLARAVRDHPPVIGVRADHRCRSGAHSYLADGRVVCWVLPEQESPHDRPLAHAVDAELSRQPVPPGIDARWRVAGIPTSGRFWELWCATEILAKLADVPVVLLARRAPVTGSPVVDAGLEIHHVVTRMDEVVVAHGLAWATTAEAGPAQA